jgi:predicted nucleotidyltransferase
MRSNDSVEPRQLVEVLFGAYRRRLLALLLLHSDKTFYVREIARLTGVPAGSLHRELKLLEDTGLLLRSTSGNQVRYQANRDCPIFAELAGIFRKTAGLADVLRDLLAPFQGQISLALVYGSVAQGKEHGGSDIDLLVVGTVSFADVVAACHAGAARLGREVNPVVMTASAFHKKLASGDRFLSRVAKEPKIVLVGDPGELGKSAEDRTT